MTERYKVTTVKDDEHILAFPFYDENGVLQFLKYRRTDFDREKHRNKEWCEKDTKPILFGMAQCVDFEVGGNGGARLTAYRWQKPESATRSACPTAAMGSLFWKTYGTG